MNKILTLAFVIAALAAALAPGEAGPKRDVKSGEGGALTNNGTSLNGMTATAPATVLGITLPSQ